MADDEKAFRDWYRRMAQRHGLASDPDDPESFYDYRAAFRADAKPDASGHWPSTFKRAGHPNEVVGGFNTRTGERVSGTKRSSESELVRLGWDAATAKRLAAMPEKKISFAEALAEVTGESKQSTPISFEEALRDVASDGARADGTAKGGGFSAHFSGQMVESRRSCR